MVAHNILNTRNAFIPQIYGYFVFRISQINKKTTQPVCAERDK